MASFGLGPSSFEAAVLLAIFAVFMNGFHSSGSFSFFTGMKPELAGPLTGAVNKVYLRCIFILHFLFVEGLANSCGQLPGIFGVSAVGLILESTGGNWPLVFFLYPDLWSLVFFVLF